MSAMPAVRHAPLLGKAVPRIGPPEPAHHDLAGYRREAEKMGITPMPWQETSAKFVTATAGDMVLFREVCIVAARQNGKTTLTKPLVVKWLTEGKRILHVAQTRELPRVMFSLIASELDESLFLRRRGKGGKMQIVWPRSGSGQEEILLNNGGSYRIAAATPTGSRGWSMDRVLIDELLAMDDYEAMKAIEPTISMAPDGGQIVYLSNAGSDASVVLNGIRSRAGEDPSLAYLEWSAGPEREPDDREGWAEANPTFGYYPSLERTIEAAYRKHRLENTMASFETEYLCRWVSTLREPLFPIEDWSRCGPANLGIARRPFMGIALDPGGTRASAAMAWRLPDGKIGLRLLLDITDSPINVDKLGETLRKVALRERIVTTGFDPLTDQVLVKFLRKDSAKPINAGNKHANASATFAAAVSSDRLRWDGAAAVTEDLVWTTRKPHDESGSFQAVRADDNRPITAALAALRAVWLASEPPQGKARIY